jgi:membrane-associated PAP2 superfamily phosphatase
MNPDTLTAQTPVQPLQALRRLLWMSGLALLLVLLWDASGWDTTVMHRIGGPEGFALQGNWWLQTVLHDTAKKVSVLAYLLLWLMVLRPLGVFRESTRRQQLAVLFGITLSLLVVSLLKHTSLTSCPWSLQDFGGSARYVSHWSFGQSDGGGGQCFPGGHASAAFAFWSVCLPGLTSQEAHRQRRGRWLFMLVLASGVLFGLAQTLRGAHYPSHTLWTALICWAVGLASYLLLARPRPAAQQAA